MPRRNRGREQYEPLDLTPEEINRSAEEIRRKKPLPIGRGTHETFQQQIDRERREERARAERQRAAEINRGMDWSVCLVPGCGKELTLWGRPRHRKPLRDQRYELPLCLDHLFVAFHQAKTRSDEDLEICVEAYVRVQERRTAFLEAKADAAKKSFLARTDGHLYVIRQNALIKVGWSRAIESRVRDYGAGIEVLAIWPGTRDDETNLHRQLTPARARGREWYHDGPILADFVAEIVTKWGTPDITVADSWTKPKTIVAGKHHRAR